MFARVVAWGFAAFLVVLPARLGIETDLLATAYMRAAVIATPSDRTDVSNQAADAATNKVEAKAESKAEDEIVPVAAESHAPEQNDGPSDTPPTALEKSATLDPAPPTVAPRSAAEPFGLVALPVSAGNVLAKWSTVEAAIRADDEILARCRDNADRCPPAAQNFLAIIAQGRAQTGRARVGVINRAINLAIQPMSDLAQWGVPDRWSAPLETFSTGRGDCEDYAIAKYVALTAAGVAPADVKLVIVRNTAAKQDHAVVAARLDGNWVMLDNRWLTLVADSDMPQVIPMFVLDGAGVRQFASPALAGAQHASAPASF
jgi:predicted transglutaminase-like cysteine proteinase